MLAAPSGSGTICTREATADWFRNQDVTEVPSNKTVPVTEEELGPAIAAFPAAVLVCDRLFLWTAALAWLGTSNIANRKTGAKASQTARGEASVVRSSVGARGGRAGEGRARSANRGMVRVYGIHRWTLHPGCSEEATGLPRRVY